VVGPETNQRIKAAIDQVRRYQQALTKTTDGRVRGVLAIPTKLSPKYEALVKAAGLELWDARTKRSAESGG